MAFTATGAKVAKNEDALSKLILDAAFIVHSAIGPGLLESAYEACLAYELRQIGCKCTRRYRYRSRIKRSNWTWGIGWTC